MTGIAISRSTQQRLVHRYHFEELPSKTEVKEMSIDGGKVRLRTPKGEALIWRDYKGVSWEHLTYVMSINTHGCYKRENF